MSKVLNGILILVALGLGYQLYATNVKLDSVSVELASLQKQAQIGTKAEQEQNAVKPSESFINNTAPVRNAGQYFNKSRFYNTQRNGPKETEAYKRKRSNVDRQVMLVQSKPIHSVNHQDPSYIQRRMAQQAEAAMLAKQRIAAQN